jgi:fermentation-respiration switch protein FrsA (DUF1100 family)
MPTAARRCSAVPLLLTLAACNGLFYHPDQRTYRALPVGGEEVVFRSGDGTALHGWFLPAQGPAHGTVLHVHGNAQNLTSHVAFVDWLPAQGYLVFVFDYRGYGSSAGEPSREGLHTDMRAALAHVRSRPEVDRDRVVVFAQSLGGAVATAVLGEHGADGVRGLALDSTFDGYIAMGNEMLGGTFLTWPLAWLLLSDAHAPVDSIAAIAPVPILFLHGVADPVVPMAAGQRLFAAAREPKRFVELPEPGHTVATDTVHGRNELLTFFAQCLTATGATAEGLADPARAAILASCAAPPRSSTPSPR